MSYGVKVRIMNNKGPLVAYPPGSYAVDGCWSRGFDGEELLSAVFSLNTPGNCIAVLFRDSLAYLASVAKHVTGSEGRCNHKHTDGKKELSLHHFLL
jgi:hypothetical protein